MKKYLVAGLAAAALVVAGGLYNEADARAKGEGIVGSAHDFTDNFGDWSPSVGTDYTNTYAQEAGDGGWNYRGEICRVCHAPHDKGRTAWKDWANDEGIDGGLLWNHALSDTSVYAMYTSDSLEGQIAGQVIGKSKLCLSCHDGTVALNAFDGQQTNTYTFTADDNSTGTFIQGVKSGFTIGPGRAGSDNDFLMGTHPISVAYAEGMFAQNPKVGRAGGLHVPEGKTFGNLVEMTGAPTVDMVLEAGMVQCHSCHDVHDSAGINAIGTRLNRAGQGLAANRGADPSGLCLSCHNK
ncbi:hypothetical protein ACHHRT_03170 [Desulfurivibrio sp. D14AmB]|uniref:hypothetical protein n=1 Tax=Desulfurivibrio sp. D14AmB TaxID=3374370 RepID=UPI00376EC2DA